MADTDTTGATATVQVSADDLKKAADSKKKIIKTVIIVAVVALLLWLAYKYVL